jgi:hypothetical protein
VACEKQPLPGAQAHQSLATWHRGKVKSPDKNEKNREGMSNMQSGKVKFWGTSLDRVQTCIINTFSKRFILPAGENIEKGISQNGDQCMDSFSQQGPFPEWGPKSARVCVLYVKFGGRAGWAVSSQRTRMNMIKLPTHFSEHLFFVCANGPKRLFEIQ